MDACLDTLSDELCQVNTHVGRIARRQACLGGFVESPSPEASEDEDNDGDSNDDGDEDDSAISPSDDEMSSWYTYPYVTRDKKGEYFWDESSHTLKERVSIGDFY